MKAKDKKPIKEYKKRKMGPKLKTIVYTLKFIV